jgi:hypothetical protein
VVDQISKTPTERLTGCDVGRVRSGTLRGGLSLFAPDTPHGFSYRDDFISAAEETELEDHHAYRVLELRDAWRDGEAACGVLRGVRTTRRRAGAADTRLPASVDDPHGCVGGIETGCVRHGAHQRVSRRALPSVGIATHRKYDIVAGISLISPSRMRFRAVRLARRINMPRADAARRRTRSC